MKKCLISLPTQLITLNDVVFDSPAWRANAAFLEDQIDHYEKWVDCFTKALRSYLDTIRKSHQQAVLLSKASFLSVTDGIHLEDKYSNMTHVVVNSFAETFRSTLIFKTNLASSLEDNVLTPLQTLIKQDLKEFKENKKQFEKLLDRFESYLNRYYTLSKQKEASSLREDAFQMHELKKLYIKQSSQYFLKLITFKSEIEQLLVKCFSNAINTFVEDIEDTQRAFSCIKTKFSEWMRWLDENKATCDHQLHLITEGLGNLSEKYIHQSLPHRSLKRYSISQDLPQNIESTTVPEKQGYLNFRTTKLAWTRRWFFIKNGWIGILVAQKQNGYIVMHNRLPLSECAFKIVDGDRRFYFEIVHPTSTICLQAETDDDMKEWIGTLDLAKKKTSTAHKIDIRPKSPLYPQELMSCSEDGFVTYSHINTDSGAIITSLLVGAMLENAQTSNTSMLSDLGNSTVSGSLLSWSIPWSYTSEDGLVEQHTNNWKVWPSRSEDFIIPDIKNYTLKSKHKELRQLFENVPENEVVLDVINISLYQKTIGESKIGYNGLLYITQRSVWFYSCTLMTHLQLVNKIQKIKVENTSEGTWILLNDMIFGLLSASSAEKMAEKLKLISSKKDASLQILYDALNEISTLKARSHVISSSTLYPSLTPLTIQAQQTSTLIAQKKADFGVKNEDDTFLGEQDSAAHTALKAAYENVQIKSLSKPKTEPKTKNSSGEDEERSATIFDEQNCSCENHLDKKEAEILINMDAKKLFETLFMDSKVWIELNKSKGFGAPIVGEWEINGEFEETNRTLTYIIPVSNPIVKARQTEVVESQQILLKKDRQSYVVLVTTKTPELPYSDAFLPTIKYCITAISPKKSKLLCSIGIQWLKSVNMFSKKVIKNESMKGMSDAVNTLTEIIQQYNPSTSDRDTKEKGGIIREPSLLNHTLKNKSDTALRGWPNFALLFLLALFSLLTIYQFKIQRKFNGILKHPISWQGIYLHDFEKVIKHKAVLNRYIDPAILKLFQEDRVDSFTWKYTWNDRHYRSVAIEIDYTKEKIGILRYEILSILRVLNNLDIYFFEKEFYNWLEDKYIKCDESLCEMFMKEISKK